MYKRKLLSELVNVFSYEAQSMIRFKADHNEIMKHYHKICNNHFITENGNKRYPNYYQTTCNAIFFEILELLKSQSLIYCYEIDGKLYTTFNSDYPNKYSFKGLTDIQNYRKAGKEDRLNNARKNNENITSGFYYPCGKPFFIRTNRG